LRKNLEDSKLIGESIPLNECPIFSVFSKMSSKLRHVKQMVRGHGAARLYLQ